jgi:hypothetical protein
MTIIAKPFMKMLRSSLCAIAAPGGASDSTSTRAPRLSASAATTGAPGAADHQRRLGAVHQHRAEDRHIGDLDAGIASDHGGDFLHRARRRRGEVRVASPVGQVGRAVGGDPGGRRRACEHEDEFGVADRCAATLSARSTPGGVFTGPGSTPTTVWPWASSPEA